MKLPDHLFLNDVGDLYDTRVPNWSKGPPLRKKYRLHEEQIKSVSDLKATLRAGPYTSLGGYPIIFVMKDLGTLAYETVLKEFKTIIYSMQSGHDEGWIVRYCVVNWENELYDDHTGKRLPQAYGGE